MTTISSYTISPSAAAPSDGSARATLSKAVLAQAPGGSADTVAAVSPLAQRLSDADGRAATRDAKLSRGELAALASSVAGQLAEVPDSDDNHAFAGLARDQLVLIAYDEGGAFTPAERKAAWNEVQQQESQWRRQTMTSAMAAYRGNGSANMQTLGKQLSEHFDSLPPIEQAQYPASYTVQLQMMAQSTPGYSKSPQLDALAFLSQLDGWSRAGAADGFPVASRAQGAVLPKPDVARLEADAALPNGQLWAKYEKAVASLGFGSQAALDAAYAEMPGSDDPARLAQAIKARDYVLGKGPSPFGSLTRNELAVIYYDDTGSYTPGERLAAAGQMNEMDSRYWNPITSRFAQSGDVRELLEMGLKAYDEALPIEKMRWGGPAFKILAQQQLAEANATQGRPISPERRQTLLDMMQAVHGGKTPVKPASAGEEEDRARPWNASWSAKLSALVRGLAGQGADSPPADEGQHEDVAAFSLSAAVLPER